jgi:hypothetical protein
MHENVTPLYRKPNSIALCQMSCRVVRVACSSFVQ